jgi:16S rRNA (guanine527-N7)-methyltransferase
VCNSQEGALDRPRDPLPTRVQDLAPLPPGYGRVLDAGLGALNLELGARQRAAIDAHIRLLLAWTAAINLTAVRDPEDVARLHVLDSLAAVPLLRDRGAAQLLDLGSGGGFPGLPLAVALPAERALLVDSVGKKVRFLETSIRASGLDGSVRALKTRSEALARDEGHRERWPAVTARAVASLPELVELGLPLVAPDGVLVAWKREPLGPELDAAGPALDALHAGTVDVRPVGVPGLEAHRLVVVTRRGSIDRRYPRDPAERRRRPLTPRSG